nr:MAG TPA: AAA domain protein [Caudoviricetes sp.]
MRNGAGKTHKCLNLGDKFKKIPGLQGRTTTQLIQ